MPASMLNIILSDGNYLMKQLQFIRENFYNIFDICFMSPAHGMFVKNAKFIKLFVLEC